MKGFAKVSNADILLAIEAHKKILAEASLIREKGIAQYYEKYYTKSNPWNRWVNRNKSPDVFYTERATGFWYIHWDALLTEFLTDKEFGCLQVVGSSDRQTRISLEALVLATVESTCLLSEPYCHFVNKYKGFYNA